jgi:hypothetical protein
MGSTIVWKSKYSAKVSDHVTYIRAKINKHMLMISITLKVQQSKA